ncbi:FCD domain-containing protein [Thermanaerosceptrum fracticalcis]|uniref:FCD domain-containing protein n=1 Tax=Thermanaerosceptrum fracticalcis TaxID=1712410 RepID=A0A7G6E7H7_THEFR|nr:GntR family transcriptional regulator [Thermanaerosceptrum fracticalcis]QNB48031.1 FCD domain-containing protein [Thermanaerosceptrum fracticalcis]
MAERTLLRIRLDNFRPLGEMVYESLRDAIINQVLKPGERLMETELAEEMGVSRTPVREAIRKLEQEGYVVMIPRKGAYVAGLSIKDIHEVFEIRGALESLAAGLAAERATQEEIEEMERNIVLEASHFESNDLIKTIEVDTKFHELIFKASKNDRLLGMISNLREQVQRFRTTTLAVSGRLKFALEEHRRIVEAIAARDVQLAQQMAKDHIESAENALLEVISYQK